MGLPERHNPPHPPTRGRIGPLQASLGTQGLHPESAGLVGDESREKPGSGINNLHMMPSNKGLRKNLIICFGP